MTKDPITITILLIFIVLLITAIISTHLVRVSFKTLKHPVPNNFRFIHISDIHNKVTFINGRLSHIINSKNPDFVVVTGDYSQNQVKLPRVIHELGNIKAPVFMVLGNYERKEMVHFFSKRPITLGKLEEEVGKYRNLRLLINDYTPIEVGRTTILIYGFDNSSYGNEEYDVNSDNIKSHYRVMLAHSPKIYQYIIDSQLEYNHILAGHTHGRQINLPYLFKTPYDSFHSGFKEISKDQYFSISQGLGTTRIPLRFNSLPEIHVFDVEA